ncbi:MAG: dihydroorotase [bacterium]|jgi:dihydroorotase
MLKALTGGRLLDPAQGLDQEGTLLIDIKTGLIKDIIFMDPPAEAEIVSVSGHLVVPGFIDLTCRPGSVNARSLASLGRAAASGGYTGITILPDVIPPLTDELRLSGLIKLARANSPVHFYPVGALSRNLEGAELADIGSLVDAGARALSDGKKWIINSQLLSLSLRYAGAFNRPLFVYPEDPNLSAGGLIREGAVATRLGLPAIPAVAEEVAVARDLLLARATGGQLHFTHLSTSGAVALLAQAQKQGVRTTAAALASHLILTCDNITDYNTNFKLDPPLGEKKDQKALIACLNDGTLTAITTNHTPVAPEKKDVEFAAAAWGGSFLRHTFPLLYTKLVRTGKLDLATLITKLTTGPAQILGLNQAGTLKPGIPADVTVIDLNATHTINANDLPLTERNTPFLDWKLSGWPVLTMVNGDIVFQKQH